MSSDHLRLFTGDDDTDGHFSKTPNAAQVDGSRLTLKECFERYLLPDLVLDRAPATISGYRTALRHWYDGTTNPVVVDIADQTVRVWRETMVRGGMSAPTLAKQWRFLRAILRRIGPRETGNPAGNGVIGQVPYCQPVHGALKHSYRRIVSDQDLGACYEACRLANWPRTDVAAPTMWRAALVLWHTYGFRTQDLFATKRGFAGIGWKNVSFAVECPDPQVEASNPHGWLSYVPTKTQRTSGEAVIVPLTECVRAHLQAIQQDRVAVFPCPVSSKTFYDGIWKLIQGEAQAIAVARSQAYRSFLPRHLRTTANNAWSRLTPGLGEWVLGHAKRGVNARFYTIVIQDLVEGAARFPTPQAFLAGMEQLPRVQMRLF